MFGKWIEKVYSSFTLVFSLLIMLSSCHNLNSAPEVATAREAFKEQRFDKMGDKEEPKLSEQGPEELLLTIPKSPYPKDWDRRKYESIESWVDRIQLTLEVGDDEIQEGRERFNELRDTERALADKIEGYLAQNEKMKATLDYATSGDLENSMEESPETFQFYEKPPFLIHLVRPNETLYSISVNYYGSGERVNDIVLWNQGWIEHPRSLKAGLALALFFDFEKEQGEKVVNQYMQTLMSEEFE
ncbi:MAG: hypothetical protein GWP59_00585 [Chlamydiales bacterium]|nr:LysM peptidoglycan-binding domain-containing protein [Chlamydiales bacterium]NCF70173.1 hypothetical protein [Chlamydiales bacterium]